MPYPSNFCQADIDLGINAYIYMVLARMIYFFHPKQRIFSIQAPVLSVIFVSLDFVSFVIQLIGGSYARPTSPESQQTKGVRIYMGGIGMQQFFICTFLGLAVKFQLEVSSLENMGQVKQGWKRLLWTLYGSLAFITVRYLKW